MSIPNEVSYPTISDLKFINGEIRARYLPAKEAYYACLLKYKNKEPIDDAANEVLRQVEIVQRYMMQYSGFFIFAECPYSGEDEAVWQKESEKPFKFSKVIEIYSSRVKGMLIKKLHAHLDPPCDLLDSDEEKEPSLKRS